MNLRIAIAASVGLACLGASPASASWSKPAVLQAACHQKSVFNCVSEPAPRVAVNTRGRAVVAWVNAKQHVLAAAVDRAPKVGKATDLGVGLRPAVAIAANGRSVVVFSRGGRLWFARRKPHYSFTKPAVLTPKGSRLGDDDAKLIGQPDDSTVVLYENAYRTTAGKYVTRLRSVVLPAAGKAGAVRDFGRGFLDHDSFRAGQDGSGAACCLSPANRLLVYRHASGWSVLAAPLTRTERIETVATGNRATVLGVVDVHRSGDAGALGVPQLFEADAAGAFGPPVVAPISSPTKSFGPVVAVDGSNRTVLVYQEKAAASAFSRTAPIYAVVNGGVPQTIDTERGYQPAVAPLGSSAIVTWQAPGNKWRVSISSGPRFNRVSAPSGPGPSNVGEDFNYNHDMAVAGGSVVLAWTAKDASIRFSFGSFR